MTLAGDRCHEIYARSISIFEPTKDIVLLMCCMILKSSGGEFLVNGDVIANIIHQAWF
jgi:hypothetical protein